MNQQRRTKTKAVIRRLNECIDDLSTIKEDEDDARDNIPENLQEGEAYHASEECSDKLEDAISWIKDVVDSLETI